MVTVVEQLRRRRAVLGLTWAELADRAGMSPDKARRALTGDPRLETADRLARAMGMRLTLGRTVRGG